jgi:hypothetical protein
MEILDCSRIDELHGDRPDPGDHLGYENIIANEQNVPDNVAANHSEAYSTKDEQAAANGDHLDKSIEHPNNIEENERINDKFSCSTPIKFFLEKHSPYRNYNENTLLSSNFKTNENENAEFKVKTTENLKHHSSINNSLIEFEENERRMQNSTSQNANLTTNGDDEEIEKFTYNSTSYLSILDEPINQMQELLFNLRNNYTYPNSNDFYNSCNRNGLISEATKIELSKESISDKKKLENNFGISTQTDSQTLLALKQHQQKQAKQLVAQRQDPKSLKNQIGTIPLTLEYARKNDGLIALENRLENEKLRRLHCEKQIFELNEHLLELQEQLAVANALDKKRELFAHNMDASLKKVVKFFF